MRRIIKGQGQEYMPKENTLLQIADPASSIKDGFEGIFDGLPNDAYHRVGAYGSTDIKVAARSLSHFKSRIIRGTPPGPSSAFDFGTCAHDVVLEKTFSRFIMGPDASKATKEWKAFVAGHPDKVVLTPDEHQRITDIFGVFSDHKIASEMQKKATVEQSHFAIDQETGLWVKARPDGYYVEDGEIIVFDYKTTQSARP